MLAGAANNYDFVRSGDSLNVILSGSSYGSPPLATADLIAKVEEVTLVNEIEYKLRFTGEIFS